MLLAGGTALFAHSRGRINAALFGRRLAIVNFSRRDIDHVL
jgi:hypothetical protein